MSFRMTYPLVTVPPFSRYPSLPPALLRRVPSLSVPPAIARVTDAGLYERARATTCSLLSLPRALHKRHPTKPSMVRSLAWPTYVIFFGAFTVAAG